MSFGQLFARQTKQYALYRPTYPAALYDQIFAFLALQSGSSSPTCLELGSGSGQATLPLSLRCSQVIALEISKEQILEAPVDPKISYFQGSADSIPSTLVKDDSIDLVACAQAFHWFDFQKAFQGIKRVLKKDSGVCSIWGYVNPILSNQSANKRVNETFYLETLNGYWSERRSHFDDSYARIESEMRNHFELVEADRHNFRIEKEMTISEFVGYLSSWSAYQTYLQKNPEKRDPLEEILEGLCADYGVADPNFKIPIHFPLFLLLGSKPRA